MVPPGFAIPPEIIPQCLSSEFLQGGSSPSALSDGASGGAFWKSVVSEGVFSQESGQEIDQFQAACAGVEMDNAESHLGAQRVRRPLKPLPSREVTLCAQRPQAGGRVATFVEPKNRLSVGVRQRPEWRQNMGKGNPRFPHCVGPGLKGLANGEFRPRGGADSEAATEDIAQVGHAMPSVRRYSRKRIGAAGRTTCEQRKKHNDKHARTPGRRHRLAGKLAVAGFVDGIKDRFQRGAARANGC